MYVPSTQAIRNAWHLQARARDKDLREREAQLQAGKAGSSRSISYSALEQREAALAEREAAMARASAAAEYARSEAETLWRSHKVPRAGATKAHAVCTFVLMKGPSAYQ